MKKFILMALMTIVCAMNASAQYTSGIREGFLNNEIKWVFDGKTLAITNVTLTKEGKEHRSAIPDYNPNKQAPWVKMKFPREAWLSVRASPESDLTHSLTARSFPRWYSLASACLKSAGEHL